MQLPGPIPNQPEFSTERFVQRDLGNFLFHLGMGELPLSPPQETMVFLAVRRDLSHREIITELLANFPVDSTTSAGDVAILLHGISRNIRHGRLDVSQLIKQHKEPLLQLLKRASNLAQKEDGFTGPQIVCIAGALESLRISNRNFLTLFSDRLAENLDQLALGSLAEGLKAFSRLEFISLNLFYKIGNRVVQLLDQGVASSREISIICRSYGMSGIFPSTVSAAIAKQLVNNPATFDSVAMSEFTRSCAIAHRRHDRALQVLTRRAAATISRFSNRDLTEIGWALAILGESDANYFGNMALELLRRRDSIELESPKQQDWAKATWSLAAMQPHMARQFLIDIGEIRNSECNSFEDELQFYQAELSLGLRAPNSAGAELVASLKLEWVEDDGFQKPSLQRMRSEIRAALEKLMDHQELELSWQARSIVDSVRVDFVGSIWGHKWALECQPFDAPVHGAKSLMSRRILDLNGVSLFHISEKDWGLATDKVSFLREMWLGHLEK